MKMRINSMSNKNKNLWLLIHKNLLWHEYNMQFSRKYDTHLPHNPNPTRLRSNIHTKVNFCVSIPQVLFLLCILFIRTFMRSGWYFVKH